MTMDHYGEIMQRYLRAYRVEDGLKLPENFSVFWLFNLLTNQSSFNSIFVLFVRGVERGI